MSTVQVPAYTTASTVTPAPLSYQVDPNIATILPLTTTAPVSTTRGLSKNPSLGSVATVTPISSVPIVATEAGPIYQVELNKRLLDGQRELKEKQADMEADKEKKLEEKADKHRTKAVKWIGRGFPGMAARHEKNATKLDVEANKHYMMAEQLRSQAKAIDRERKAFDPPKEEKKKPVSKNAAVRRPAASAAPGQRTAPVSQAPPQQRVERPIDQRPMQPAPLPQRSEDPSLRKEETVAPVRQEPVAAPVEEVKTTEKKVETPEGEKIEKKEEKHHLHHAEKTEQTAGGSSH